MKRRRFLAGLFGGAGMAAAPCLARSAGAPRGKVVVVGGGYGGATAAKYLRVFSAHALDVTLVEPAQAFVSSPLSNLVLGGSRGMADITVPYDGLVRRHGVRHVRDAAVGIDAERRRVRLANGSALPYDRLILSPGIGFMWDQLPGMSRPGARDQVLHAWQAGPQTSALRRQIEAMPDGGVYALTIPLAPYRCPPAPYERACQVAWYLRRHKPRAKVLVFDANPDLTSEADLFRQAWDEHYAGIIEYQSQFNAVDVDAAQRTAFFELGETIRADVLNMLPPMRAGAVAVDAGLATANGRWCEVDFLTFESRVAAGIHILGDAIQIAPQMPKSGHMANQHGKVCAAAVWALLSGQPVNPLPLYANTCYSFTTDREVMHVASVHRYDAAQKTMLPVPGAGGLSAAASAEELPHALGWAANIWADMLG
ncbi:FCSD flavin-binding domain-containing protein [Bordetella petrii]|uniref:FCSD flavin-binding domain-containing protein n=1 Tax=Bordetella petrii TaxID=94624 RepID=UPI003730331A